MNPYFEITAHVACGPKGAGERGVDSRIRFFKSGSKCIALLTLETRQGPISFAAAADEKIIGGILMRGKNLLSSGYLVNADDIEGGQAARLAQRMAREGLIGKVQEAMKVDKKAAAERLYIRLTQKDKTAWHAVRTLVAEAKAGNPKAAFAWKLLLQAHARSTDPTLGHHAGTLEQQRAASRIYDRLQRGDSKAWADLMELAENAEAGDPKSIRAWAILAQVHEGRMRGALVGRDTRLELPEHTADRLNRMAKAALQSQPLTAGDMGVGAWQSVAPKPNVGSWRAYAPKFLGGKPRLMKTLQDFFEMAYDASPKEVQDIMRNPSLMKSLIQAQVKDASAGPQAQMLLSMLRPKPAASKAAITPQ